MAKDEKLMDTSKFEALKEKHDEQLVDTLKELNNCIAIKLNGKGKKKDIIVWSTAVGIAACLLTLASALFNIGGWRREVEMENNHTKTALTAETKRSTDVDIKLERSMHAVQKDIGEIKTGIAVQSVVLERIEKKL